MNNLKKKTDNTETLDGKLENMDKEWINKNLTNKGYQRFYKFYCG